MVKDNTHLHCRLPNVPLEVDLSVLDHQVGHIPTTRKRLTKKMIEDIAVQKYRLSGKGITFQDLITCFSLKKSQAQRSLKHSRENHVLFTARDLKLAGIPVENNKPQQYYPK